MFSAPYSALVVKASGLAAGKGVVVAKSIDEACQAVVHSLDEKIFGDAGSEIVVEEFLEGEEISVKNFVHSLLFVGHFATIFRPWRLPTERQ